MFVSTEAGILDGLIQLQFDEFRKVLLQVTNNSSLDEVHLEDVLKDLPRQVKEVGTSWKLQGAESRPFEGYRGVATLKARGWYKRRGKTIPPP